MENLNTQYKKIDLGETLNHAFEIYKKMFLMGGLSYLIIIFFMVFLVMIGLGFFFNLKELPELMKDFKPENFSLTNKLIYFGSISLVSALISPFSCGLFKMAEDADHNKEVTFSSLFTYINSSRFIPIITSTILVGVITNFITETIKTFIPGIGGVALGLGIVLVISILNYLMIPLILFKEKNVIDAIKTSFNQTKGNFFMILLLMLIAIAIAMCGFIALCIGFIFTMPFIIAMHYAIYKSLN